MQQLGQRDACTEDESCRLGITVVVATLCMPIMCIGFSTDGEWNSLRMKGNTRPLSVLEVRTRARNSCSRLSHKKMIGMLTPLSKFHCVLY